MADRHRRIGARVRRIAMLSAATATATVMTVGIAPLPEKDRAAAVNANVGLAAAITLLPNRDRVPDLSGGLGAQNLVNKLLVDIPANLLPDILATIALDLP